ncbi:RluA family pseudouridine synthase [Rubripirellula obstinata]|nr:RluA family pseudouridine synthase [Rubripirellula obstinata]
MSCTAGVVVSTMFTGLGWNIVGSFDLIPKPAPLSVLYEDNHLLVIDKPAGIATMGAESGPTLHSMAADYIRRKYNKPGKVFVGIVSRLDTVTTGVIVMARTSKAASRLTPQFAAKDSKGKTVGADKIYLAAIPGHLEPETGSLTDWVYKDDDARRMRITNANRDQAKQAQLRYVTVAKNDQATLLAIRLISGRKHQIRVQLADRGLPIFGDRKYGSKEGFASPGIALHSWKLSISHPTLKDRRRWTAELPRSWKALGFPAGCLSGFDEQF